jgi:3-hydroxybutyryl-CoA dehydratase
MKIGDSLPEVSRDVTHEVVSLYANASGDLNPLHTDPVFASNTHYGRMVAHGMLILAYISDMMAQAFGNSWSNNGQMRVRFRLPVYIPSRVSTFGLVKEVTNKNGSLVVKCLIGCKNEDGEEVINGEASVTME